MVDNGPFSSGQSAYLCPHSTVTHLPKYADDWYSGLELDKLVGPAFIDLAKAFDTVDYEILCKKLAHYRVQQLGLTWFKSYLYNRKQLRR